MSLILKYKPTNLNNFNISEYTKKFNRNIFEKF